MEEEGDHLAFTETQRFPPWIKATALLPVAVLAAVSTSIWLDGPIGLALVFSALTLALLLLAVPNFLIKLVTKVDSRHLHLRIEPSKLPVPFLPPRARDVPLDDIAQCEVRTYRVLRDREYWGNHFWGLGTAFRGTAYIYVMNASPFSGRGVQLQLKSGERLLLGSRRPEALAGAIALAMTPAG